MAGRSTRALATLVEQMGFPESAARDALKRYNGDLHHAVGALTSGEGQQAAPAAGHDAGQPPQSDECALAALDDLLQQSSLPTEDDPHEQEDEPQEDGRQEDDGWSMEQQQGDQDEESEEPPPRQPARKRRVPDPAAAASSQASAAAASTQASGWQWQAKAGWQDYDAAVCQHLEVSFASGEMRTQVQLGGSTYVIDFEQLCQFPELWQGRRRNVRRHAPATKQSDEPSTRVAGSSAARQPRNRQRVVLISSDEDDEEQEEEEEDDDDFDAAPPARSRGGQSADRSAQSTRRQAKPDATAYCTFNGHFFLELSIENAERMENCP